MKFEQTVKDYTGQKINMLTYVRATDKQYHDGSTIWEALCDCGNIIECLPYRKRKHCGCLNNKNLYPNYPNYPNYTNQKHFMLTFIRPLDYDENRRFRWEALCDCGNVIQVIPYKVISGDTQSCGCYSITVHKKAGLARRQYDPVISSARDIWKSYQRGDKRKGIQFDIGFDDFYRLTQLPCHYYNRLPRLGHTQSGTNASEYQKEKGLFLYNGIDRVDNTRGHVLDNVVPCCRHCNQAKMALTIDEFRDMVSRIYHNYVSSEIDIISFGP